MENFIQKLKNHCIEVDLNCKVGTEKEIKSYYKDICFTKLLHIFNQYNGLECYKKNKPRDFKESYSIDYLQLENLIKQLNN
jgi:hypothetical protein